MVDEEQGSPPTEEVQPEPSEADTGADLVAKKLIDENRKYRAQKLELKKRVEDAEGKLSKYQEDKLEQEGKFKESSEFYKKKATELEEQLKSVNSSYGYKVVTSQVNTIAAEMGCVDKEALISLAPINDLYDDIDEDFNVKIEAIKGMLDMMQQKRPWLFEKRAPKMHVGVPAKPNVAEGMEGKSAFDLAKSVLEGAK